MAFHDVDRRYLGLWAKATREACPELSQGYSITIGIGLSMSPLLVDIRRELRSGGPETPKRRLLQDRILLLARYGIEIAHDKILSNRSEEKFGQYALIMGVKLRASYYHVICILRNEPSVPMVSEGRGQRTSMPMSSTSTTDSSAANRTSGKESIIGLSTQDARPLRQTMAELSPTIQAAILRDQALSMDSETSNVTNPFSSDLELPRPPPGFFDYHPTNPRRQREWAESPEPQNFLYKQGDWRSAVNTYFLDALAIFNIIPASDPLRAILTAEYCAFLWDCMGDFDGCRVYAQRAINDVYNSPHPISDEDFKDTSDIVILLGVMKDRRDRIVQTSKVVRPDNFHDDLPSLPYSDVRFNPDRFPLSFTHRLTYPSMFKQNRHLPAPPPPAA